MHSWNGDTLLRGMPAKARIYIIDYGETNKYRNKYCNKYARSRRGVEAAAVLAVAVVLASTTAVTGVPVAAAVLTKTYRVHE